ncbi:MAG: hypothetical protein MZW92_55895 [Comamonadaceae bacterium]|nr:hypothetical protein [Comamonadaceae bacterium]
MVLSRSVEPGNAVAASLQAVTLFTLAEDLTQDEAAGQRRRGRRRPACATGQKASFTVSAYPSRRYPAHDHARGLRLDDQGQRRHLPRRPAAWTTTTSALRPGMTATATITTVERSDVLLVPNAALRFTPRRRSGGERRRPAAASSRA